ncbi:hypothetical protein [Microbacterium sp. NPDC090003]|uniref:hypothetical protein n=1 Tax=Microbacterium sp. NPDC090003 TaxID=3364203 RepID=UPI00380E3F43
MMKFPDENALGRLLHEDTVYSSPLPEFIQTLSKADRFHWQKVATASLYGIPLPLSDPRGQLRELASVATEDQVAGLRVFVEKATQLHAYSARSSGARISFSQKAGEDARWEIVELTPEQRTAYLASLRAILQRREAPYSALNALGTLLALADTAAQQDGDLRAVEELRRWRAACLRLKNTHPDVMTRALLGMQAPETRHHPKGIYSVYEDLAYSGALHDSATARMAMQTKDEVGAALYEKYAMDWLNGYASAAYGVALLAQTALGKSST